MSAPYYFAAGWAAGLAAGFAAGLGSALGAAGSAIGYRMLTLAGVRGADAGFGLVAAGMGSAVMLNVILWVTLFVSIPLAGFRG